MNKQTPSTRWLLTDKILAVMREQQLTFEKWARRLDTSQQRLHSNVWNKHRGMEMQNEILVDLKAMTGKPMTEFYQEER